MSQPIRSPHGIKAPMHQHTNATIHKRATRIHLTTPTYLISANLNLTSLTHESTNTPTKHIQRTSEPRCPQAKAQSTTTQVHHANDTPSREHTSTTKHTEATTHQRTTKLTHQHTTTPIHQLTRAPAHQHKNASVHQRHRHGDFRMLFKSILALMSPHLFHFVRNSFHQLPHFV